MSELTHAAIIPLIGGLPLGVQQSFGRRPEYLLSYTPFFKNDEHLVKYYKEEVPYYQIDEGQIPSEGLKSVDVVSTTCPCAGLSSLSTSSGADNVKNEWMYTTSRYVLEHMKPRVFFGENAPRLATETGKKVRDTLKNIGKEFGYTMLVYQTKSLLHGIPQVRDRTFYFFFREDHRVPVFPFYRKDYQSIEELIRSVKNDPEDEPMNKNVPSEDLFYKFILDKAGMTHKEFSDSLTKSSSIVRELERVYEATFKDVAEWSQENGFDEKYYHQLMKKHKKLEAGGGIMRKGVCVPKDHIGAFVGHLPLRTVHPDEDRYLTVKECMAIMKMPEDFEMIEPRRRLNHLCQNVPVTTARSMADMVKDYLTGKNPEFIECDFMMIDNRNQRIHSVESNTHGSLF